MEAGMEAAMEAAQAAGMEVVAWVVVMEASGTCSYPCHRRTRTAGTRAR